MPEPETLRDLRRGQIVRAARALVAERGVPALTFAALEQRLTFTRGVVTHHFKNKDELVEAVLDDAIAEIDVATDLAVAAAAAREDKLAAALSGMVQGFLTRREAALVLLSFWGRLNEEPRLAEKNAALYARWRGHAAAFFREGQARGAVRGDVDPEVVAVHLVGAVIGVVTQHYFAPGAVDVAAATALAAAALAPYLRPDAAAS